MAKPYPACCPRYTCSNSLARRPLACVCQRSQCTTSTNTTTTTTITAMPTAGTGSLEPASGSTSQDEPMDHSASAASSAQPLAPVLGPATNPGLLDFVADPLAIHCMDASELDKAFTLFDPVLQKRLAFKKPSWTVLDCIAEAVRHFHHLGPAAVIHTVVDEVAGPLSTRLRPLPLDARPVGLGICVVDVPHTTTLHSHWAKSPCILGNLPPRLAKGLVSARTFRRHLPPFVPITPVERILSLSGRTPPRNGCFWRPAYMGATRR